jgi:ABC-type proline/glycine betaine transport system ATPase subunit
MCSLKRQIDAMNRRELIDFRRRKVSMVFQNFGLFTTAR